VSRTLPWAAPRNELLVLALVAVVALSPVNVVSSQDVSRLCLSRAMLQGHLAIGRCDGTSIDRARYDGRNYSDKAPGLSILAVPVVWALHLPDPAHWSATDNRSLWVVRLLTNGVAFLVLCFCVGRLSEGLTEGTGALAIVAIGLGTLLGPLASTTFDHVLTAALLFGGFLLAWARRETAAGVAVGCSILVEYEAALAVPVIAVYLGVRGGREALRFLAGLAPPLVLLGAYDWAAFGSPLHPAYRYVANRYAADQRGGLYGVSLPHLHAIHEALLGDRGLLVTSPFLIATAAGLVLLRRRARAEVATAAALAAVFLFLDFGYFLPLGGISPGPRFLVPSIPFFCIGFGPALARWRALTLTLVGVSVVATTVVTLTWALSGDDLEVYRQTVWGELVRWLEQGSASRLGHALAPSALGWIGLGAGMSLFVVVACASLAFAAAATSRRPRLLALPMVVAVGLATIPAPAAHASERRTVAVTAGHPLEFAFSLSAARVTTGWVRFRVSNAGRIPHDFAIRGSQTRPIAPGRSATLTVWFAVPGVYSYTCTLPGHASAGMVGDLTVSGPRRSRFPPSASTI
jgi:uncharacterized cupredoxin-like copper-binding protein